MIQRKRWGKIAEYLRIPKGTQDPGKKLDDIYCKYILPYDTLSPVERDELLRLVEEENEEANKRKLERSRDVPNTFHLRHIWKPYTTVHRLHSTEGTPLNLSQHNLFTNPVKR